MNVRAWLAKVASISRNTLCMSPYFPLHSRGYILSPHISLHSMPTSNVACANCSSIVVRSTLRKAVLLFDDMWS